MIWPLIGVALTLLGIYGARAVLERWQFGTLGTLALGWFLGMVFVLALILMTKATGAA